MSVWTKTGHNLLPKTNSECSQMDFPLPSQVNERKQGSASQGLHCDSEDCSTFNSLIEGNLWEFGTDSYLPALVREDNPHLGSILNRDLASAFSQTYVRMSETSTIYIQLRRLSAKLHNQLMPASLNDLPVLLHNFLEGIKNKGNRTQASYTCETCYWNRPVSLL